MLRPRSGPWENNFTWRQERWDGEPITIAVTTSEIAGFVSTPAGEPAVGLKVSALRTGHTGFYSRSADTDAQGHFRIRFVPHGSYALMVKSEVGSANATVQLDRDVHDLALRLEPSERQVLHVQRSDGQPVKWLTVLALDSAGRSVASGDYTPESPGVFVLDLPSGPLRLLISHHTSVFTMREVTLPGEPLNVVLEPGARLTVQVPALEPVGTSTAKVWDQSGEIFSPPPLPRYRDGVSWPVWGGVLRLPQWPAGVWTIRIQAGDGQVFETTVETNGMDPVNHVLE